MIEGTFRLIISLQQLNDESYIELDGITQSKIIKFNSEKDFNNFVKETNKSNLKYINEVF